jgi:hypothetical protein
VTRTLAAVLGSLLLAAAAPASLLPLPPPLPVDPPTDEAAPIPNTNARVPSGTAQEQTAWALRVYSMPDFDTGEGYIPGSAYQSPEQRKPIQTPGFMITVPLQ